MTSPSRRRSRSSSGGRTIRAASLQGAGIDVGTPNLKRLCENVTGVFGDSPRLQPGGTKIGPSRLLHLPSPARAGEGKWRTLSLLDVHFPRLKPGAIGKPETESVYRRTVWISGRSIFTHSLKGGGSEGTGAPPQAHLAGRLNAMYLLPDGATVLLPPPAAITTYCLPSTA